LVLRVYLSSSFSARESGEDDLLQLRRDLQTSAAPLGIDVVLGEDDPLIEAAAKAGDHLRILEGCARLIGTCQAFFGMTFERHGSRVVLGRNPLLVRAQVSFFEAELLEACFQTMPCCVVQVREMQPSSSMEEFLGLVSNTLGKNLMMVDRADIPAEFLNFARTAARGEAGISPWLFDPVSVRRVRRGARQETLAPHLSFLSGSLRADGEGDADLAVVKLALQQVTDAKHQGAAMEHISRLSYLWIAMREFARATPSDRVHSLNAELQQVLGLWNESAAWHGLHGSHPMGCLATLNELAFARTAAGEDNPPNHPRASAYHSIGNKIRLPVTARRFYRQAVNLCETALKRPGADAVTLRQQRASAYARLAMLGEKWRYLQALRDFRFAFDGPIRAGVSPGKIGEAQTEYAYALFKLPFRRTEALRLMDEGMDLLRSSVQTARSGFFFRAARKQGEMLEDIGDFDRAESIVAGALELAESAEAFDQSRNLAALLTRIRERKKASRAGGKRGSAAPRINQ
jgi:tetratricopeptide (TPR) repeat protein